MWKFPIGFLKQLLHIKLNLIYTTTTNAISNGTINNILTIKTRDDIGKSNQKGDVSKSITLSLKVIAFLVPA